MANGKVYANEVKAIFYHAHEFAELEGGNYRLTFYQLRKCDIECIYDLYLSLYRIAKDIISKTIEEDSNENPESVHVQA
jgi:hypothetical protein